MTPLMLLPVQKNWWRSVMTALLSMTFIVLGTVSATASPTAQVIANIDYPIGIVQDSSGNIFIADNNRGELAVVPTSTGTLFGVQVVAGQKSVLSSVAGIYGLAIDTLSGSLVMTAQAGALKALSPTSVTVFGVAVPANTLTTVTSSFVDRGIDFDSAGNLYGASSSGLFVLPVVTGTLHGQLVTANTPVAVSAGSAFTSDFLADVALDTNDALYLSVMFGATGVYAMPVTTRTIFGVLAPADTFTRVVAGADVQNPCGIDLDDHGVLYIGSWGSGNVNVSSNSSVTLFEQPIPANVSTQLTSLNGFGNQGVSVNIDSSRVISGANPNTYALVGTSPYVVPTPTPTPTGSAVVPNQLVATGSTSSLPALLGIIMLTAGLSFLGIRKFQHRDMKR